MQARQRPCFQITVGQGGLNRLAPRHNYTERGRTLEGSRRVFKDAISRANCRSYWLPPWRVLATT